MTLRLVNTVENLEIQDLILAMICTATCVEYIFKSESPRAQPHVWD